MTLKVGDLVRVAQDCCGRYKDQFLIIENFENMHPRASCSVCGHATTETVAIFKDWAPGRMWCGPLSWLKKIDPPAEGETTEAYKNLKVPA